MTQQRPAHCLLLHRPECPKLPVMQKMTNGQSEASLTLTNPQDDTLPLVVYIGPETQSVQSQLLLHNMATCLCIL